MIPEDTLENAPLYVLGELDRDGRAAFEAQLARSPELRGEVRRCAETFATLAGGGASHDAPPAHVWANIEAAIAGAGAPTMSTAPADAAARTGRRIVPLWWSWGWPVAAAVLLGLNFLQWVKPGWLPRLQPFERGSETARAESPQGAGALSPATHDTQGAAPTTATAAAASPTVPSGAVRSARDASGTPAELAQARARAQRLIDEYRRLAADYDELAEAVIPLLASGLLELRERGVWTVELQSRSGVEGGATAGLWTRVQQLAPANGVALLADRWRLGPDPNAPPGVAVDTPTPSTPSPYALAVLNNEQGLGYLDLYNAPALPPGSELRLWLQNEGGSGYTAVGAVPGVLAGGSGGLVFRIPEAAGRASRVVITIEPVATPPQPSGPVVIEGP